MKVVNTISAVGKNMVVMDTQCGYRAYSKKILDTLLECEATGYGIETEQLKKLEERNFKLIEKPVTIRYRGLERTSKKHPVSHGAELVGIALRLIIEERPLLFLGVPGMLLIIAGIATGTYLMWYFNTTRYFSVPMALITLGSLFVGTMLFIASLMLYAISRLDRKLSSK